MKLISKGFTIIEMVIFVVIVGLAVGTVMIPLTTTLQKTPVLMNQLQAQALAQERMELILNWRKLQGYTSLADPCVASPGLAMCSAASGYTVTATITSPSVDGDSTYRLITVTVSGAGDAVLKTLVADEE